MQRAYASYPPDYSMGKLHRTTRNTFVNRYVELATVLDVHLANVMTGPGDTRTAVISAQASGFGNTMFGLDMVGAIFNRPPERGADRERVMKLLQDADLGSLRSCPWAEVEADTDTNVLVAAFSRAYQLKGQGAAFTGLRGVKPVYIRFSYFMDEGGKAITSRMLSSLKVCSVNAARLVNRDDGLALAVRALTQDGARGCVLVLDDVSDYLSRRDERYGALRMFIAAALEAGAIVYVTEVYRLRVVNRLVGGGGSDSSSSPVFQPRFIRLPALEPADIAEIVAAVFQQHPDIAKKVIAREDSARVPTAEEVAAAAQTLGRVIFQVTGGRSRFVQDVVISLFDCWNSWSLNNPGTIAKFIFNKLNDIDASIGYKLSVRDHLRWCLGDVEPSKVLLGTFHRHLLDMLALGAQKPYDTLVEDHQLGTLLPGYRAPFTLSNGSVSMFAGDIMLYNIERFHNKKWGSCVHELIWQ
ncbi:MAG: hypothetical protein EOO65_03230, partial [Methanosarcinales archaeon]